MKSIKAYALLNPKAKPELITRGVTDINLRPYLLFRSKASARNYKKALGSYGRNYQLVSILIITPKPKKAG